MQQSEHSTNAIKTDITKPNIIKRLFSALWQLINGTRKLILNLIFFFFIVLFIAAVSNEKEHIIVPNDTALVLDLYGDIVEQKHQIEPFDAFINEAFDKKGKPSEILLSDIIAVINKAKDDDRIKLLVLNLEGLKHAGLTKLREVGKALNDFKSSKKQIIAIGEQFSQDQYYLASYADKIWMNPQGWLLLEGYASYPLYYKSALAKLNINQHIFRVGTYKSAVEPFIRDNMSTAAKEANSLWLNELWATYKADVAKNRGFALNNFDETTADLISKFEKTGSNIAEYALANHFVDSLKTREQMRQDLIALVGNNKAKNSYSHIDFDDYLTQSKTPQLPKSLNNLAKVAVIVAKGEILNGEQQPGMIGGDSTARLLRKARKNSKVKAVVLRVDSPGGSAYASEIIRQEVELLKAAGKPVVASMGTYAASGGYWISAPADKIYATPTTITGSIGIFGMMMTFEDTLAKLGIYSDGVGTTELAGFSPVRPMSAGMAKLFQLNINRGYHDFISLVAQNRHMTLTEVDAIAQGRVWTGKKAKELGLVDELGNLDDAIAAAASLAKLDDYEPLLIEQEVSAKDKLLQNIFGKVTAILPLSTLHAVTPNSSATEKLMAILSTQLNKMSSFNDPQGMYSRCESCEID
ncbi:MAG: signal peptide peptidase SppA [Alteromonadaceae bacterium]|nr:signal peptide peptidase SppA [Alteromonadaceae bacterium]